MQTRLQSLFESAINILIGLLINLSANAVIFPLFGWQISAAQNIGLGVIYTAISIVRSYALRRLFNRLHRGEIIRTKHQPDQYQTRPATRPAPPPPPPTRNVKGDPTS